MNHVSISVQEWYNGNGILCERYAADYCWLSRFVSIFVSVFLLVWFVLSHHLEQLQTLILRTCYSPNYVWSVFTWRHVRQIGVPKTKLICISAGHLGERALTMAYLLLCVTFPGFISIWDVEDYCLKGKTSQPPEREYNVTTSSTIKT